MLRGERNQKRCAACPWRMLLAVCLCLATAVQAAPFAEPTARLPEKLSDFGALNPAADHPDPALIPYEPAWPLWSNGSDKQRFVHIPPGARIDTSDPADWRYPVGTTFFKTFSFQTRNGQRRIETRVIRGLPTGWEFAVYEWDADNTGAVLADIASPKPIEHVSSQGALIRHEIPSRLQCRQCHEANGNFILGFSELNLNDTSPHLSADRSQLRDMHERGLTTHIATRPAGIDDDDLNARSIRGYIQGNCTHCHNGRSQVDLRHQVFLRNTLGRPTRGFLFPPGQRIQPGHPEESLLYLAASRTHPLPSIHMPPVGVQTRDEAGISQLAAWITSLAGKSIADPPGNDLLSRPLRDRSRAAAPGFVPDRHASSVANPHAYVLDFERVTLDGDHAGTRGFTSIRFMPGSDRFLLAEHEGIISLYALGGDAARRLGTFRLPDVCVNTECGIVAMELDPDFSANGFFYVGYCHQSPAQVRVVRLRLDRDDFPATAATLATVIAIDAPGGQPWHTIGSILFDGEKCMWVLTGERGLGAPAARLDSLLGAVLRIVPNRDPAGSGYTLPDGNPRAHWYTRGRGEIFAKGLRNPWTATFDPFGRLWIADVGQQFEEINLLHPRRGFHDFGWPAQDGHCNHGCRGAVNPVIAYTRSADHRYFREDPGIQPAAQQCIYVGPYCPPETGGAYRGRLNHTLLFGDFILGWVRGFTLDAAGRIVDDRLLASMPGITSWSMGPDGYFYITTFAAYTQDIAAVFRLVPN